MSIINFTVQHDQFAAAPDNYVETDSGIEFDVIPLIGYVYFTPQSTDLYAAGYTPRPAGFKMLRYTAYIGLDGRLRSFKDGPLGVRLPANDPVFELSSLQYRVDWDLHTPAGERVPFDAGYFDAPSSDSTVWLAQALSGSDVPPPDFAVLDGGFFDSEFIDVLDGGFSTDNGIDMINGGTP